MSGRDHEHGIEDEPHRRARPARDAPHEATEAKADRALRAEAAARDPEEEAARHSVFNEPGAIFPPGSAADRSGTVAARDWSCDHCGYNLRGLAVGDPCPECGRKSLYQPAPLDHVSYGSWLARRVEDRRGRSPVPLTLGLALVGGAWAVLTSIILEAFQISGQILGLTLMAPIMEEIMKVAVLAILVERRPYLFSTRGQVIGIGVASAIGFASIENALYILVYTSNPSAAFIAFRVIVCTALHVACTTITVSALARVWHRSVSELREPVMGGFTRALILAIVVHGVYNAGMYALAISGWTF